MVPPHLSESQYLSNISWWCSAFSSFSQPPVSVRQNSLLNRRKSGDVNQNDLSITRRNPKLFWVSTESSTSTVVTSSFCYQTAGTVRARHIEQSSHLLTSPADCLQEKEEEEVPGGGHSNRPRHQTRQVEEANVRQISHDNSWQSELFRNWGGRSWGADIWVWPSEDVWRWGEVFGRCFLKSSSRNERRSPAALLDDHHLRHHHLLLHLVSWSNDNHRDWPPLQGPHPGQHHLHSEQLCHGLLWIGREEVEERFLSVLHLEFTQMEHNEIYLVKYVEVF